jgi:hypothetical protein
MKRQLKSFLRNWVVPVIGGWFIGQIFISLKNRPYHFSLDYWLLLVEAPFTPTPQIHRYAWPRESLTYFHDPGTGTLRCDFDFNEDIPAEEAEEIATHSDYWRT